MSSHLTLINEKAYEWSPFSCECCSEGISLETREIFLRNQRSKLEELQNSSNDSTNYKVNLIELFNHKSFYVGIWNDAGNPITIRELSGNLFIQRGEIKNNNVKLLGTILSSGDILPNISPELLEIFISGLKNETCETTIIDTYYFYLTHINLSSELKIQLILLAIDKYKNEDRDRLFYASPSDFICKSFKDLSLDFEKVRDGSINPDSLILKITQYCANEKKKQSGIL
jgi:hypothetical protein